MAHARWHGTIIKRWKNADGSKRYLLTDKGWMFETGPREGNARTLFRPNTPEEKRLRVLQVVGAFEEVPNEPV